MTPASSTQGADVLERTWSIDQVIDERAVTTLFRPVVLMATTAVVGFQSFSRGPHGTAFDSPMALAAAAAQAGRSGELDWLCRAEAMRAALESTLPETMCWLIDVEPAGLAVDCPSHLAAVLVRAQAELQVVLEVGARDLQRNALELIHETDRARRDAWGVALGDVGADEGSLALLPLLRPDVVKLDMSVMQSLSWAAAAAATSVVRAYADNTGAVILAEGVDTRAQEELAKVFGATYGQGDLYGGPGPLPTTASAPRRPIPLRQYVAPVDGRTPFEALSARLTPQRAGKDQLLHISTHLESAAVRGVHASVLLAAFQRSEFFTAAKQRRYRRLAESNAFTAVVAHGLQDRDEPSFHIGTLAAGNRFGREWVVVVLNAHFAAAFVAREADVPASADSVSADSVSADSVSAERQFDFVYTHDRDAVIDAARCFLQDLDIGPATRHTKPTKAIDVVAPPTSTGAVAEAASSDPAPHLSLVDTTPGGFAAAAQVVLNHLNSHMPMSFWSITRVENGRQTYLYLDDNDFELVVGGSHPWEASFCIHMVSGAGPGIAPDVSAVPIYAATRQNLGMEIGAYAGATIGEPDGSLFGVICGLDRGPRPDLAGFDETLATLSHLLTIALTTDRVLQNARQATSTALSYATIDSLTGIHNRYAWDARIAQLDRDYGTYGDPTVIVIIDLDDLKSVNDGPGGHNAGDQLLRTAAGIMGHTIRDNDFLARLGGDEFGIIFADTPAVMAPTLAGRVERALGRARVKASVGWSAVTPGDSVHQAIEQADQGMYENKRRRKQGCPDTAACG